jgi:hypothetical protein
MSLEAALRYASRGWRLLPIPRGQKKPAISSWPNFVAAIDDLPQLFGDGQNIAVRLGRASGELVDLDLDGAEAMVLADLYLPKTGAEFGRASLYRGQGGIRVVLGPDLGRDDGRASSGWARRRSPPFPVPAIDCGR